MIKPTKKQRAIRKRALTLRQRTDSWVVPNKIHELIDADKLKQAEFELAKQKKAWPNDPEIIGVQSLIYFLRGSVGKKMK